MIIKWTTRNGVRKALDVDAIMRLEYVPTPRPMLTVMTCDILDTICGRPEEPIDGYNPDNDTTEVITSDKENDISWTIPDQMVDLYEFLVKTKGD